MRKIVLVGLTGLAVGLPIAILLSVGAADIADAVTYKDIAGKWCGDLTDYVFTPDTLNVKFHDGRPATVFKINKYTPTPITASVLIGSTLTAKRRSRFSPKCIGNATKMAQHLGFKRSC